MLTDIYEAHAHIMLNGRDYQAAAALNRIVPDITHIRNVFSAYQKSGIRFIRDGGDNLGVSSAAAKFAREYGIDYRTPAFALHKSGFYGSIVGRAFSNESDFIKLVGEVTKQGGDFIKLMASGILDFDNTGVIDGGALSLPELKTFIRIAHSEGYCVMVHANGADTVKFVIDAGADSIEHGFYMDEEALSMLKEAGAVWVPTLAACKNLLRSERFNHKSVNEIARLHEMNISRAIQMGCPVALGSDAGAYCVDHAKGAMDEYIYFSELISDITALDAALEDSFLRLKARFRRMV